MLISLENVSKTYNNGKIAVEALKNINIEITEGEFIAIVGTSGSGKSTLLNILGLLDKCTEGTYKLNGQDIGNIKDKVKAELRNKNFGFVVQYFALINDYTSFENIEIPLEYAKVKKSKRKALIVDILEKLNISDKEKVTPKELSGGQNQRVAIARALVNNPHVILADEPTGALDSNTSKEVMDIFQGLNKEGKTIIIVTHDVNIANYCNRIISIEDGRIVSDVRREVHEV
ncbi:putative ABC transport system ATP-binding protein [Clostridium amylolyticum]|uniref:Putative ABC transport system ATP-binding protein n=1 Tax=Clostridium amylolyticum TaxID=1121298 RepID=A0A1M6N6J8_9CLOT|nr:ABC transporter ATP-binding protein [Clostridium amylolyticum]SHJ91358.1 putative ABC transport system ATP-binding protein [Clostridium amylolyticum]